MSMDIPSKTTVKELPSKEPRQRVTVPSDFLEFKRAKREERRKRLDDSVAQKRELYIKPSTSTNKQL